MFEFCCPFDGDVITDPKMEWLEDKVINKGPRFWNSGAGEGFLTFFLPEGKVDLLLRFNKKAGFFLQYVDQSGFYVSLGSDNFHDKITVYIGGDPLVFPSAFFISRDAAWLAVEDFCKTGERSNKITWKKKKDIKWDPLPPGGFLEQ